MEHFSANHYEKQIIDINIDVDINTDIKREEMMRILLSY